MELDMLSIEKAAASALDDLRRTALSGEAFSDAEVSAIAHAIASAIAEYDQQTRGEA